MLYIREIALRLLALVVGMCLLSGCASQTTGRSTEDWSSLDNDTQRSRLAEAERRIDSLLAAHLGLDTYLGVDARQAGSRLPRLGSPSASIIGAAAEAAAAQPQASQTGATAVTAGYARPNVLMADDSGATAAASNGLSLLDDLIKNGLGKASENDDSVAEGRSPDGANPQFDWAVENGEIAGNFSETVASDVDGAKLTMAVEGEFLIQACPDPRGMTSGEFSVSANVELDSKEPRMVALSAYEMGATINAEVNDEALATSMEIDVHGHLGDAQSTPGAGGSASTTGSHVSASSKLSFSYGEKGAAGAAAQSVVGAKNSTVGKATQEEADEFSSAQQDMASMIAQRITNLAEDYWRDGNCVYVVSDPAASTSLQPGGSTPIEALPYSRLDDSIIEFGTIEGERKGTGAFSPSGPQKVRTKFTYLAPENPGHAATVEFAAISRRGIGRTSLDIKVVDGWTFSETYEDVTTETTKCDGLFGEWTLRSTAPFGYKAKTEFTMGETLTAPYKTSGSVAGQGFSGTGTVTLVEVKDGEWELHASTGANVFHLKPAEDGACN